MVKAIYGLVTVLPVLALMRDHPPAAWVAAAAVLGTTLAVALADGYSELIGTMLHRHSRLNNDELSEIGRDGLILVGAAVPPTIVLVLSILGFVPIGTAIDIAQGVVLVCLFGYSLAVGFLLHVRPSMQFLNALAVVGVGLLIVAIKSLPVFHQ